MRSPDELHREIEALRERISRLSAASVRISASLDLNTVLQEVVDSARALTAARYGLIATVGEAGQGQGFVTSGFTPDEHRQLAAWPDAPRLFEHLRELTEPFRLRDLPSYVRSLGFSSELMRSMTLLGTSIRNQGAQVGYFFLAEKEDGSEFTSGDEEVLVLFASQAATAIVNARTHRGEQQARADLEALIETSPVGVAVFEARSGNPKSFNREARRIVESLCTPDIPPEELHKAVVCRRADGREVTLNQFPMAHQTNSFDTVRAEEVVLSVPDGRSVTTLINATPIASADGTVESVVVTLQDLAPLEELERSRAEFLALVSHELRAPLAAIKGSAVTARGAARILDPAEVRQFFRIIEEHADQMDGLIGDLLDAGRIEAGMLSVDPEPSEVAALVDQARNTFLSGGGRHTLQIDLPPDLPRVMVERQRIVKSSTTSSRTPRGTLPSRRPSGSPRRATAFSSRSRSPTRAGACRRINYRTCSASMPAWPAESSRAASWGPAWAWPSRRDWSRPTAAASGPRAAGRATAQGSPSRFRWPKRPSTAPRPASCRAATLLPGKRESRHASWWSTTTLSHCGSFGMLSMRPATHRT